MNHSEALPPFLRAGPQCVTLLLVLFPLVGEGKLPSWMPKTGRNVTFLALPDFDTDPNEGETFGVLPVWMLKDDQDQVRRMYAPSLNYNQSAGVTGTFRFFDYPSNDCEIQAVASYSQENNQRFLFDYLNRRCLGSRFVFSFRAGYSQDGFARFYGLGPDTDEASESNYSRDQFEIRFTGGRYLTRHFRVELEEMFRITDVRKGILGALPDTRESFSGVPGLGGSQVWLHQLSFIYDSRDSVNMPKRGFYAAFSAGVGRNVLFGRVDEERYTTDFRYFHAWGGADSDFVSAIRLTTESVGGRQVPFSEIAGLGGSDLLRGYGADRFTDNVLLLVSLEQRCIVHKQRVFDLDAEFEVSPFFDAGVTGGEFGTLQLKDVKPAVGIGLRGLTRPDIVGSLDIALGEEGVRVFIGLGYTF